MPQFSHWSTGLSRRGFLYGAGTTLALPWLASMPLRAETGKRTSRASSNPPVRFACIYFSNGVEPIHWWAKGEGANMELGPGPSPLHDFRQDIVVVDGLFNVYMSMGVTIPDYLHGPGGQSAAQSDKEPPQAPP